VKKWLLDSYIVRREKHKCKAKRLSEKSLSLNFYIKLKNMVENEATPTAATK